MSEPSHTLSVIVPVLNEEGTVEEILRRVLALPIVHQVVVVDDGSTDTTPNVLRSLQGEFGELLRVVAHPERQGKGAAIRSAIPLLTGELSVIQDADLEYDPQDLLRLAERFESPDVAVVYGSRVLGAEGVTCSRLYYLGGRGLSLAANMLYSAGITDEPTCYKMLRTSLLKGIRLRCTGFEFCPEVTAIVRRLGFRIHEVPISFRPRGFGEGKKIRAIDGVRAVWTLLRYRFAPLHALVQDWGLVEKARRGNGPG